MLVRVLNALETAGFALPTVVVGYGADCIRETVGNRCRCVVQEDQLGTGDAARVGVEALPTSTRRVLLVHGDEPLIPADAYREMLDLQLRTGAPVVLLTARVTDTRDFGRLVRDDSGRPVALVQEGNLSAEQRSIDEVNLGAYVFDVDFLRRHLASLRPHPPKGEYYLTDVIAMTAAESSDGAPRVEVVTIEGGDDILGINDLVQLEAATRDVYRRTNRRLMENGVRIVDSVSTFIGEDVLIEPDTAIQPFTVIEGPSRIGGRCEIGPGTTIRASQIGAGCEIRSSTIEESVVDSDVTIGPYAHLRPGSVIGRGVHIGNYAEIKGSTLGPGTRMHHMSYVGDAQIGANVNIGAGTVTCNFDGVTKHRTIVEDDVFLGSDTMLRAPIRIGRGAYTGAGSVVVRDVPAHTVVAGVPARIIREAESSDEGSETADSGVHSGREA